MVTVIDGNLFDSKAEIIAHQVNCQGVMGSGVALQVKERFPSVFQDYTELCNQQNHESLLGSVLLIQAAEATRRLYIANLFAQITFGYAGQQFTDLKALQTCFDKLCAHARIKHFTVAMPWKISSDRGGADWNVVYKMIEDTFTDVDVELWRISL